jgi:uncharacterized protein YbdZ (MbtH family)
MKEYVTTQLANAKARILHEKKQIQGLWRTEIKAPTGWFWDIRQHACPANVNWLKFQWKSNPKNPAHRKAYNLFRALFQTMNYVLTGIAILIVDFFKTAGSILTNLAKFARDLTRVVFASVGLLAEGITWGVVTAGNAIINRLPSKDKKPANSEEQAQPDPNKPPPPVALESQAELDRQKGINVDISANESEVNVSAKVDVQNLKRWIFG